MVGTLKYMSPEQVQGQKIDSRADLFSVGVVLYQLLTDKRPFDGDNDFSIIHQIIGHTPAPPSSFNARLPSAHRRRGGPRARQGPRAALRHGARFRERACSRPSAGPKTPRWCRRPTRSKKADGAGTGSRDSRTGTGRGGGQRLDGHAGTGAGLLEGRQGLHRSGGAGGLPREISGRHLRRPGAPAPAQALVERRFARPDHPERHACAARPGCGSDAPAATRARRPRSSRSTRPSRRRARTPASPGRRQPPRPDGSPSRRRAGRKPRPRPPSRRPRRLP